MKKYFLILLLLPVCAMLRAQQTISDPLVQKRDVGAFHAIEVSTGIELFLTAGTSEEVAVSAATEEFRDRIVSKVENGTLKLYYDNKLLKVNRKKENKNLKAYVSYKMLDQLSANTGAIVKIQGVFKGTDVHVKVNTGAQLKGEVAISSLEVKLNTGSQVILSGSSDKLEVEGDTGSKFNGEGMRTSACNVNVSTGANVTVNAEKEIQAKAHTGGNIRYKGDAVVKEIKTGTGGSVKRI